MTADEPDSGNGDVHTPHSISHGPAVEDGKPVTSASTCHNGRLETPPPVEPDAAAPTTPPSQHQKQEPFPRPTTDVAPQSPLEKASPTDSKSSRRGTDLLSHLQNNTDGAAGVSEWSHQQIAPQAEEEDKTDKDPLGGWQTMPSYADWDMFDDDGRQIAEARPELDIEPDLDTGLGGAGKGYTKVFVDEDARSTDSLDENTAYLFKEGGGNTLDEDDEEGRDPLQQMQATKSMLNDHQKFAYIGLVRLAMAEMLKALENLERTRGTRKQFDIALEAFMMWTQKMMLRLYGHMELDTAEQLMIEQLSEHGLQPGDLTPSLMENARVNNPMQNENPSSQSIKHNEEAQAETSKDDDTNAEALEVKDSKVAVSPKETAKGQVNEGPSSTTRAEETSSSDPPPSISDEQCPPKYEASEEHALPKYEEHGDPDVQLPSELPRSEKIDIDLRWTVLCDLFLALIADSMYDARSRTLLEKVGSYLDVTAADICRFEKRVTEALEMQEAKEKEKWNEDEHIENRRKLAKRRRLVMMGLATAGGTLIIGLSGGILGPVIGTGLAAGFTAIGVTGTSTFLGGVAGAAIVGTGSAVAGGAMGVRAAHRRTGAVSTFEYRPLYNNKRVNLILTIAGWLNGKVDDPRLPFSTVDPVMGDLYSLWWEPEMLTTMGQTLTILATEALTQALQQVLASTFLTPLMGALQLPIILGKLTYLVDNPWSVSVARADRAALILADSLVDRNLGARPITLVGFSIGARVIFSALLELAKRGAIGLIQNVFLFGSPMVAKKDDYLKARMVVAGRFVNAYSTTDWILSYLFRATSGGVRRVAGLASVDITGIENFDVTQWVNGHMAYRTAMPRLLREVGFAVTSDEFSEIEDADPDNHQARQRELIDEIEEARKEIHNTSEEDKNGWSWFKRKKAAEKSSWEIYDDKSQKRNEAAGAKGDLDGTLFDVEAIKKEVVEIGAQALEVKQLESTMPTLKLNDEAIRGSPHRPVENLRGTKSDISLPLPKTSFDPSPTSRSLDGGHDGYDTEFNDGKVTMSFDIGESRPFPARAQSLRGRLNDGPLSNHTNGIGSNYCEEERSATPLASNAAPMATPVAAPLEKNVWDDKDEFEEKEQVEMSFA